MTARGLRNKNPGNSRVGSDWNGLADRANMTDEQLAETEFCVFAHPTYGIRVIVYLLLKYQSKYGLSTIYELISRWAPSVENDTNAYADYVSQQAGVDPHAVIDISAPDILRAVVMAIIKHENGSNPYTYEIDDGIKLGMK